MLGGGLETFQYLERNHLLPILLLPVFNAPLNSSLIKKAEHAKVLKTSHLSIRSKHPKIQHVTLFFNVKLYRLCSNWAILLIGGDDQVVSTDHVGVAPIDFQGLLS